MSKMSLDSVGSKRLLPRLLPRYFYLLHDYNLLG